MGTERTSAEVIALAKKIIKTVTTSPGAIPMRFSISEGEHPHAATIRVKSSVPERDTNEPTSTYHVSTLVPYNFIGSDENLASYIVGEIYQLVRGAYLHECDEAFQVAGVRVFDPHAGEDGTRRDYQATMQKAVAAALRKEILAPGLDPA